MAENGGPSSVILFRIEVLEQATKDQFIEIKQLNADLVKIRTEEAARERNQLRWGVSALGAVVMTLGAILWAYRGVIFK